MRNHQLAKWTAMGIALTLLPACSGLLDSKQVPDRTFLLSPYAYNSAADPMDRGLSLDFMVIPGLDSDQMLTLGTDAELNNLFGVRWPDHLPEFVGSLVRQSLQESGRYSKVSDKRNSALGDCSLELEAQQFYTLLDGSENPKQVSIAISGHHECDGKLTPIALKANAPVSSRQVAAIVAAHQSAMNQATRSLHEQLEAAESQLK
jgi:ABC-type uncharacterized transport system auxiliary subunit